MGIKDLKPTKNARTHQGYYDISESKKYIGRDKTVIYRSSWEKMFCNWCERNPQVVKWASESVAIKYLCPLENKIKNYYPDFLVKLEGNKTILVEVKPESEYKTEPKKPKRKTKKAMKNYQYLYNAWLTNQSKFKSAIAFCKSKGWGFKVADENWFKLTKK
jgi:hypothetical protein